MKTPTSCKRAMCCCCDSFQTWLRNRINVAPTFDPVRVQGHCIPPKKIRESHGHKTGNCAIYRIVFGLPFKQTRDLCGYIFRCRLRKVGATSITLPQGPRLQTRPRNATKREAADGFWPSSRASITIPGPVEYEQVLILPDSSLKSTEQ